MKLVVNSAYGYLAAGGGLTRFADVHAANEVTRRGRETLEMMCRELAERGVTLLEADTDGVYFAVPRIVDRADERRVVSEVAALLPPLVQLEFEGRYAAMLSHEPKNYALLALRRRRCSCAASRFGRAAPSRSVRSFSRRAIRRLLVGRRRRCSPTRISKRSTRSVGASCRRATSRHASGSRRRPERYRDDARESSRAALRSDARERA